jgi:hypothetical protein
MQSNAIRVELVLVAATEKVSLDPFLSCMFSSDFISQFSLEHPEKRMAHIIVLLSDIYSHCSIDYRRGSASRVKILENYRKRIS